MSIIKICKALSLNSYCWVEEDEDNGTFAKNNLYENPFSTALTPNLRQGLRSLFDFKFKKHPCDSLPEKRLRMAEE